MIINFINHKNLEKNKKFNKYVALSPQPENWSANRAINCIRAPSTPWQPNNCPPPNPGGPTTDPTQPRQPNHCPPPNSGSPTTPRIVGPLRWGGGGCPRAVRLSRWDGGVAGSSPAPPRHSDGSWGGGAIPGCQLRPPHPGGPTTHEVAGN